MSGSPLTLEERYLIHAGFTAGLKPTEIARQLRRDRSVIYDERLRGRNDKGVYCPCRGQEVRNAASARSAANSLKKPAAEWRKVGQQLQKGWSPEQISGRRKRLNDPVSISIPAIYKATQRHGWQAFLHAARLRQHMKRPARRAWDGAAESIHIRPEAVNLRIERGHWEVDSALGKKKDIQRVVVMVERQSLYLELALQKGGEAATTSRSIKARLGNNGIAFHSLTTDRGSEFADTGRVFKGKAYVCDPHAPNQRGTNENQIGMMRVDLPKGATMDHLRPAMVRKLQDKYNHRPRKCLGFLTPYEVAFNRQPRVGTRS